MGVCRKIVCHVCKEQVDLDKSMIGMYLDQGFKYDQKTLTQENFQELIDDGFTSVNDSGWGNPKSLRYELFYSMNSLQFIMKHKQCIPAVEVVADIRDKYFELKYLDVGLKWKKEVEE